MCVKASYLTTLTCARVGTFGADMPAEWRGSIQIAVFGSDVTIIIGESPNRALRCWRSASCAPSRVKRPLQRPATCIIEATRSHGPETECRVFREGRPVWKTRTLSVVVTVKFPSSLMIASSQLRMAAVSTSVVGSLRGRMVCGCDAHHEPSRSMARLGSSRAPRSARARP